MIHLIAETPNNLANFVLKPQNYTHIYHRLQTVLGKSNGAIFARPDVLTNTTKWTIESELPIGHIWSFDELSKQEQDLIADEIEEKKAIISKILAGNNDFKAIIKQIFSIVSIKDVKVLKNGDSLQFFLTQWGCKSNDGEDKKDPLLDIINIPRDNRARVVVEIKYTNGEVAVDKNFILSYLNVDKANITDKNGLKDFGKFLLGSTFSIYDNVNGFPAYKHDFTIIKKDINEKYEVIFPLFTEGTIKVVNQKNTLLLNIEVLVEHNNKNSAYSSGKLGIINLNGLEVGKEIIIKEKNKPENSNTYTVIKQFGKDKNEFILQINTPLFANATIQVIDEKDEVQLNYDILTEYEDREQHYNTGNEGIVNVDNLEVGKSIKVINKNKPENFINFIIDEVDNNFILRIVKPVIPPKPEPKLVKVKLVNHKNVPLPNIPIDFSYNKQTISLITNEEGICILAHESFVDKEKVKAMVNLPINYDGNKKAKTVKKGFTFKAEQLDYVIKLRKINWWWLLLLLPLLLLIPLEKTVYVKTINSVTKTVVPKADVRFSYQKAFLYDFDSAKFLTNDNINLKKETNEAGLAEFAKLKYSVYSYIFKYFSSAKTFAISGCYVSDTLTSRFHSLSNNDTIILRLYPALIPLDFAVVDVEDSEPLPDSKVIIESEFEGKLYIDSAKTSADGRVVFDSLSFCGRIKKVKASLEYYYPDSIENKDIGKILGAIQNRMLKLKPLKKPITFFVVDCMDKAPIAGATVQIEFDLAGKKKTKKVKTNVNGVGKGTYDSAYLQAIVDLEASKIPYYKNKKIAKKYKVEDFIKLSQEERTICLEPEENCTEFKNVDEKTGKPLGGAKNIVKITNVSNTRIDTLISNTNGIFKVCFKTGDKISIIATYPPDYEDNDTKVKDADGIKLSESTEAYRTIPLKIKEVEILFRIIDEETGTLISDANLQVSLNGLLIGSPNNSGNGEFTVKMPINSLISIEASKNGYGSNSTKIKSQPAKFLETSPQNVRDIPLKVVLDCNQNMESGTGNSVERTLQLGNKDYNFILDYDMYNEADEIVVYCGPGKSGKILYQSGVTTGNHKQQIAFNAKSCNGVITVVIITSSGTSSWKFSVSCP